MPLFEVPYRTPFIAVARANAEAIAAQAYARRSWALAAQRAIALAALRPDGLGATVALPLLDAMIPARTALAQTAAAPKLRMGFIYFPHGAIMSQFTPATKGLNFEIPPILKPLEAFKKELTVVSNLENRVERLSYGARRAGFHPA